MPAASRVRIYSGTARNLRYLARRLRAGDVVGVPTETVYGLAANALDSKACAKIFRAKRRPRHDPLIVHLHTAAQLPDVCEPNDAAKALAAKFWPGPLTLILPKSDRIPDIVTAGGGSVAVRVPAHPLFRRLLRLAQVPLAAPSANPFGYVSPTTAEHVKASLGDRIRHILDGGPCGIGLESTIVDLRTPAKPRVLRPGAISREAIAAVLGRPVRTHPQRGATSRNAAHKPVVAPGLLARHYSPRTRVVLHRRLGAAEHRAEAYLFINGATAPQGPNAFSLDPKGHLPGVARRLFATLRAIDAQGFRKIHVELATGVGLAEAINDRLRRAAAR